MKCLLSVCAICAIATALFAVDDKSVAVEQINRLTGEIHTIAGVVTLKGTDRISTKESFKPPVEIIIIAKTESTDLRISYAADQVIFNWGSNTAELRVDGGPANKHHKPGAGQIPKNKFVAIKWVVLPNQQQIYVDGDLRFEHKGDYSTIDKSVAVFCNRSKVTVKSITVRDLADTPQSDAGRK